jgi:hypothetical protein
MPYEYPDSSFFVVTGETCKFAALTAADRPLPRNSGRVFFSERSVGERSSRQFTGDFAHRWLLARKAAIVSARKEIICGKLIDCCGAHASCVKTFCYAERNAHLKLALGCFA